MGMAAMEDDPISVLIADDHPIFRQGLKQAIETDRKIKVIGEAGDGEAVISLLHSVCPDVVILDISMPKKNGFEVAKVRKGEF